MIIVKFTRFFPLIFMLLIFFSIVVKGQDPNWLQNIKKIVPLSSTKADVDAMLGGKGERAPYRADSHYYLIGYKSELGQWHVQYSTGKCSDEKKTGYDVPEGVVIRVHVSVDRKIRVKRTGIDWSKFERYFQEETSLTFYDDPEAGVGFVLGHNMLISSVSRFPSRKFHHLRCGH